MGVAEGQGSQAGHWSEGLGGEVHLRQWRYSQGMATARAWVVRPARVLATPWGRALAVLWVSQVVAELAFSFALPFIPLYVERDLGVADVARAGLWAGIMAAGFALSMATMGRCGACWLIAMGGS